MELLMDQVEVRVDKPGGLAGVPTTLMVAAAVAGFNIAQKQRGR